MGFIVVTEEPSSREVGDVIIVGDNRPHSEVEMQGASSRCDIRDVAEIWGREPPDVEEEIAEDQDDEEADDEEAEDDEEDHGEEEDDDEEEDDEADPEAEDDDTDSERA